MRGVDLDFNTVAMVIGFVLLALGIYTQVAGLVSFAYALRTVRIRTGNQTIWLNCADARAMFRVGFLSWSLPALLIPWGLWPVAAAVAASLALWPGFRLTVRVTATGSVVLRRFLYVVPWKRQLYARAPRAFTDGWGDEMDPEAINIDFGDAESRIELAWGDSSSGTRCDDLAAAFNRAVDGLAVAAT
jgi:hypothetical protein